MAEKWKIAVAGRVKQGAQVALTLSLIQSRLVRNEMVYFYWTNRRDTINTNSLKKEQITNHFAKSESFTTKVQLHAKTICYSKTNNIQFYLVTASIILFSFSLSGGTVCEPEEPVLVWFRWPRHLLPSLLQTRSAGWDAGFHWSDPTQRPIKLYTYLFSICPASFHFDSQRKA